MMRYLDNRFRLIEVLISLKDPKESEKDRIDNEFRNCFLDCFCDESEQNREALERVSYQANSVYGDPRELPIDYGIGINNSPHSISRIMFEVEHYLRLNPGILEDFIAESSLDTTIDDVKACLRVVSLLIDSLQAREIEVPD